MKVLSIVGKGYYGSARAVEPMYRYFSEPLVEMGHAVDHFDHAAMSRSKGRTGATNELSRVLDLGWDLVLYQTGSSHPEPIDTSVFSVTKDRTCVVAWNSDDDWQWDTTAPLAPHFTWMVTTYPQVFATNQGEVPNLLLSQWGCLTSLGDPHHRKDIDFSFAGWVYKSRALECRRLARHAGLQCFGKGARFVNLRLPEVRGLRRLSVLVGPPIDFTDINGIWNRTAISFTPLTGGHERKVLSIKSRLFDMGRSGTVALTQRAPYIDRYFDPDTELVIYDNIDDCIEKARWLRGDDRARSRIATAYAKRIEADHLWTHRWRVLLAQTGLT